MAAEKVHWVSKALRMVPHRVRSCSNWPFGVILVVCDRSLHILIMFVLSSALSISREPIPIQNSKVCGHSQPCFEVRVPEETTMLQAYNCDRQRGQKTKVMPAEKQVIFCLYLSNVAKALWICPVSFFLTFRYTARVLIVSFTAQIMSNCISFTSLLCRRCLYCPNHKPMQQA